MSRSLTTLNIGLYLDYFLIRRHFGRWYALKRALSRLALVWFSGVPPSGRVEARQGDASTRYLRSEVRLGRCCRRFPRFRPAEFLPELESRLAGGIDRFMAQGSAVQGHFIFEVLGIVGRFQGGRARKRNCSNTHTCWRLCCLGSTPEGPALWP